MNHSTQPSDVCTDDMGVKTCCVMTELNYVRLFDYQESHLIQPCYMHCIVSNGISIVNVVVFIRICRIFMKQQI